MRREDERKLKTTEMRMLRMLCGKTLNDRVNNDRTQEVTGVESIDESQLPGKTKTAMSGTCGENGQRKATSKNTAFQLIWYKNR